MNDEKTEGTIDYRIWRDYQGLLGLRETYYDGEGVIVMVSPFGGEPIGETVEVLADQVESMRLALDRPILDMVDHIEAFDLAVQTLATAGLGREKLGSTEGGP